MPFKATEQQQNAIEGKGALLVSAAAGSGKMKKIKIEVE